MKTLILSNGNNVTVELTPENAFEEAIIDIMNLNNLTAKLEKSEKNILTITINPHVK